MSPGTLLSRWVRRAWSLKSWEFPTEKTDIEKYIVMISATKVKEEGKQKGGGGEKEEENSGEDSESVL